MSQSRYTLRGASKTRYLARRIKRRGVLGSVKHPPQRRIRAFRRMIDAMREQNYID